MGSQFFILGLPRSRTAWLSYAMTSLFEDRDRVVEHDMRRCFSNLELFSSIAKESPHELPGFADTGLLYEIQELVELFPDSRYAVVCRSPEGAYQSLCQAFPSLTIKQALRGVTMAVDGLQWLLKCPTVSVRAFDYDRLSDYDTFMELAGHCLGYTPPLDSDEFDRLCSFNVQVHKPTYNDHTHPEYAAWLRRKIEGE